MNDEFTIDIDDTDTAASTSTRRSRRGRGRGGRRRGPGGHMHDHHDHHHAEHDRGGRGGRDGRGGRHRARRGAVPLAIFTLLDERPMHGYEIITELESRSDGRWRPSPGSIYPTLDRLEDRGALSSTEVDGKRQFSLTDRGRQILAETPRRTGRRRRRAVEPVRHRRTRRHAAPDVGARWPGATDRPVRLDRTARRRHQGARGHQAPALRDPRPPRERRPRVAVCVTLSVTRPTRSVTQTGCQSRWVRPLRKSIERVTVAATKRSSLGAAMNRAVASSGERRARTRRLRSPPLATS